MKLKFMLDVVVYTLNSSTQKAEAGEVLWVQG